MSWVWRRIGRALLYGLAAYIFRRVLCKLKTTS
jgi:hypothetical protein